jgi:hypothetical protein
MTRVAAVGATMTQDERKAVSMTITIPGAPDLALSPNRRNAWGRKVR